MVLLVEVQVLQSSPGETFDPVTRKKSPKVTSDGKPCFTLMVLNKMKTTVGNQEFEEVHIDRLNSTVDLKPGKYLLAVENFIIEGKLFLRATGVHKSAA